MLEKFEVIYLHEAIEFLDTIDTKARRKILFNIHKVMFQNDPALF